VPNRQSFGGGNQGTSVQQNTKAKSNGENSQAPTSTQNLIKSFFDTIKKGDVD